MILSCSRPRASRLRPSGKYFGAQPESSQKTLPLWSATAVISSIHGQPGWAATMGSVGKILDHLVLRLRRPRAVPVLAERLDERALGGDPLLRAGIAVKIDAPHRRTGVNSVV